MLDRGKIRRSISARRVQTAARVSYAYGLAVATVAVAFGLNWLFQAEFGGRISPLFFAAIAWSSWYGGLAPGLVATGLAGFVSVFFFYPPLYSMHMDLTDSVCVVVVVSSVFLVSTLRTAR